MRALRFLGWFLASVYLPGLALWRSGNRGAAVIVASSTSIPTLLAYASLRWSSLAFAVFIGGIVQFVVAVIGAAWGATAASRQGIEKWPTTAIFAGAVLLSTAPMQLWRARWSEPFTTAGESMAPSLISGDQFFVRRPVTPARGAVVVFEVEQRGVSYVKRIVGLAGDTVSWRGGQLSINGTALATNACPEPERECHTESIDGKLWRTLPGQGGRLEGDWQVPPGHVFVMGDNRDNAEDSRTLGPMPISTLTGAATYIHFSWPNLSRAGRPIDPE